MSSREILFNSPTEEKDGSPASAHGQHGRPLSLHRKAPEQTPSGSLKHLKDPLASPVKNQAAVSSMCVETPLDAALSGDIPGPPESVIMPESLEPTNIPLSDTSISVAIPEPEGGKLDINQSHNTYTERLSPRLNGDHQHRAVKKFRPPENLETLTPEMGGHDGIKCRKALHHCDHQNGTSLGSSNGDGSHLASHSDSREKKRNPGKVEEMETEDERDDVVSKPDESR